MYYKAPDNSLHFLSDVDIENGGESLLPAGCIQITDAEAETITTAQNQLTPAQIEEQYHGAVQAMLDAYAQSMRYDSMISMSTYVNSTNAQFKAESTAALAWRDAVWASCYATLAAVQAGTKAMPASPEAFIATLPAAPAQP